MSSGSHRKGSNSPPEACVEVLASVVRPEAVESKVFRAYVVDISYGCCCSYVNPSPKVQSVVKGQAPNNSGVEE